jgi:transcriptional regulator GlxA family with amidase domain
VQPVDLFAEISKALSAADFLFMQTYYSEIIAQKQVVFASDPARLFTITPPTAAGLPRENLQQVIDYINMHLDEDISLAQMANHLCMSQYHFARLFKQAMGVTFHVYLVGQRVGRAKQLLRQEEQLNILEIADQCGFANPSHLAKQFREHTGLTPRQFRLLV